MNACRIDTESKTAKVYKYLMDNFGQWKGTWEITLAAQVASASTHISAIRARIRSHHAFTLEKTTRGRKHFYRIAHR